MCNRVDAGLNKIRQFKACLKSDVNQCGRGRGIVIVLDLAALIKFRRSLISRVAFVRRPSRPSKKNSELPALQSLPLVLEERSAGDVTSLFALVPLRGLLVRGQCLHNKVL